MASKRRSRETFGDIILRSGKTLAEVARESGVARRTLTYWDAGRFCGQDETLRKVAATLGGMDPVRLRDAILASGGGR